MPFVNVKILEGATTSEKAELVARITEALVEVLRKRPEYTHVVIDDVDPENWGISGELTSRLSRESGPVSLTTS